MGSPSSGISDECKFRGLCPICKMMRPPCACTASVTARHSDTRLFRYLLTHVNSVITVRFYGTARPSTITERTLPDLSMPAPGTCPVIRPIGTQPVEWRVNEARHCMSATGNDRCYSLVLKVSCAISDFN
jgi:hypothetical protein